MFNKKFIMLFIVIVSLFLAISSASASDLNQGADVGNYNVNILSESGSISDDGIEPVINDEDTNGTNDTSDTNITNETGDLNTTNTTGNETQNTTTPTIEFAQSGTVTTAQVYTAAAKFKSYVLTYEKLPSYVAVGSYNVSVAQFSYLMACAIKNINAKHASYKIKIIPISTPKEVYGDFIERSASLATYVKWAKSVVTKGSSSKYVYSYIKYDSRKLAFKDYTLAFAKILAYYKSKKKLATSVTIKTFVVCKYPKILLGSNSYGKVELIGPFGNTNSSTVVAYSIGVHVREYQAHDAAYYVLNNPSTSLKYCYYIYRIVLKNPTGKYETDRMRGQLLAQKFIVPHAGKMKYNLFVDVHSTNRGAYKYSYIVFAPGKDKKSSNIAKKIVSKSSGMRFYFPYPQTSPKYLTLPVLKKGIPAIIFETVTEESYKVSYSRLKLLVKNVDHVFDPVVPKIVTVNDVLKASKNVYTYKSKNKKLPSTVKVGSYKVTTAQFSYLMGVAIKNINANKTNSTIKIISVKNPGTYSPKINKNFSKSYYIVAANRVISYITSKKAAPNYVTMGKYKVKYSAYVSSFAYILSYYYSHNKLPSSCKFKG